MGNTATDSQPPDTDDASVPPVLSVKNISKSYQYQQVLRNVTFDLSAGHSLLVLGCNGAGKTTLLSIIAGRIAADKGRVTIGGNDLKKNSRQSRQSFGFIGHEPMLHPGLQVRENLSWFARALGLKRPDQRVKELIARFEIGAFADRETGRLSRGQAQRVSLARALMAEPPLLLLDEPFTALDERGRSELKTTMEQLRQAGKAILVTMHETALGLECATEVGLLIKGRIDRIESTADQPAVETLMTEFRQGM